MYVSDLFYNSGVYCLIFFSLGIGLCSFVSVTCQVVVDAATEEISGKGNSCLRSLFSYRTGVHCVLNVFSEVGMQSNARQLLACRSILIGILAKIAFTLSQLPCALLRNTGNS